MRSLLLAISLFMQALFFLPLTNASTCNEPLSEKSSSPTPTPTTFVNVPHTNSKLTGRAFPVYTGHYIVVQNSEFDYLYTDRLFMCAAVVIQDKERNVTLLAHIAPDEGIFHQEEDIQMAVQNLETALLENGSSIADSDITIVWGSARRDKQGLYKPILDNIFEQLSLIRPATIYADFREFEDLHQYPTSIYVDLRSHLVSRTDYGSYRQASPLRGEVPDFELPDRLSEKEQFRIHDNHPLLLRHVL